MYDFAVYLAGLGIFIFCLSNLSSIGNIAKALNRVAREIRVHNQLEAQKLGLPDPYKKDEEDEE